VLKVLPNEVDDDDVDAAFHAWTYISGIASSSMIPDRAFDDDNPLLVEVDETGGM